jgi:hypothetical protein
LDQPAPGKLTAKELAGRRFWYWSGGKADFVLGADGRVKEYPDPEHEVFWRVDKDGKLLILNKDGKPTHIYDAQLRTPQGTYCFEGTWIRDGSAFGVSLMEQKP